VQLSFALHQVSDECCLLSETVARLTHSAVSDFVVQLGIASQPQETSKWDVVIPDDPVLQSNLQGFVSFATAGASTRTTQIFINMNDNPSLDKDGFSPFARVIEGMEVIKALHNPTPGDPYGASQDLYTARGNVRITYVPSLMWCRRQPVSSLDLLLLTNFRCC
jgi:peptidyl-prolyl cis-trans isomerase A (cyclophilin A)